MRATRYAARRAASILSFFMARLKMAVPLRFDADDDFVPFRHNTSFSDCRRRFS